MVPTHAQGRPGQSTEPICLLSAECVEQWT